MRKRFLIVGLVALLLMAAVPGAAFAAGRAFSANADLTRTDSGNISLTPAGIVTLGQVFQGTASSSDWRLLDGSPIVVNQNSQIGVNSDFSLFGAAWGSFTIGPSTNAAFTGQYQADLTGQLFPNPSCPALPASFGPLAGARLGFHVDDTGMWASPSASGALSASADGCLAGVETASVSIQGNMGHAH